MLLVFQDLQARITIHFLLYRICFAQFKQFQFTPLNQFKGLDSSFLSLIFDLFQSSGFIIIKAL